MADLTLGTFIRLETQVWDALMKGDATADSKLLAEDFLGVYSSGFADRSEHVGQLVDGPTVASFKLSDSRILMISDEAVLHAYRADWYRAESPDSPEVMYISSLWVRRSERWINVFSQDTPADDPP